MSCRDCHLTSDIWYVNKNLFKMSDEYAVVDCYIHCTYVWSFDIWTVPIKQEDF